MPVYDSIVLAEMPRTSRRRTACRPVARCLLELLLTGTGERVLRLCCVAALVEIATARVAERCPSSRCPSLGAGVVVHVVDVLKAEIGALVEEEEDDDRASEVATCEHESVRIANVIGDESGEECLQPPS